MPTSNSVGEVIIDVAKIVLFKISFYLDTNLLYLLDHHQKTLNKLLIINY